MSKADPNRKSQGGAIAAMAYFYVGAGILLISVILFVHWYFRVDCGIGELKTLVLWLRTLQAHAPLRVGLTLFIAYMSTAALCIPLEVPFALVTGALFGLQVGVCLASFASVFGATIAFLGSRYLLRAPVMKRFPRTFDTVNSGVQASGAWFVVSMRLQPIVPFTLVNLLLGLTEIKTSVFYIASQLSMLFGTIIFVNAGTRISELHSYAGLMSPSLVASLLALGLLPWIGKAVVSAGQRWRSAGAARKPG